MMNRFRKGVALLLCCALLPVMALSGVTAAGFTWGDINGDGAINAADALLALQHSVKLTELTGDKLRAADVNGDGAVNAADALLILQYSVKLIDRFPVDDGEEGTDPVLMSNPFDKAGTQTYRQRTEAKEVNEIRTTFQNAGGYSTTVDVPSDSVMVYMSTIGEAKGGYYKSWENAHNSATKSLDIMIPGGRDNGKEYYAMYPERSDWDAQKNSDGSIRYHTKPVAYMCPTRYYTAYKLEMIKACCALEPGFIAIEEPECWMEGCYNEGFKEEWQDYYGEEWQDPHSTAEARYKASKLMVKLWVDMFTTIGEWMKENAPDVGLVIATHSGPNYIRHSIAAGINTYTSLPYITGIIAQVWSDTINSPTPFEYGYLGYGSFPDSMRDDQVLFTLTDAKADNSSLTWERCQVLWEKSVTSQLMNSGVNNFQECVWPTRGYTPAPLDYKARQLNVFQTMRQIGGQPTALYAGTPGISLAFGDTFTWLKNYADHWMVGSTPDGGFLGLAMPMIERGVPLTITSLDHLQSVDDLAGVKVLMVSYDVCKPLSEQANVVIADWVKQGGTVLYIGGRNAFDDITVEWWDEKNQTPYENLISHLGLNVNAAVSEEYMYIDWCGDQNYGSQLKDVNAAISCDGFIVKYTGSGFDPILRLGDSDVVGFDAKVGSGRFISVGIPANYFNANREYTRQLVQYALKYTDVSYLEAPLMTIKRGDFVVAESLQCNENGSTLTGDFVDLFDSELSVITEKTLEADQSALLKDVSGLRTAGTPRLAFTGGSLQGDVGETADTTTFTISGPSDSYSSTRLLGNGRSPKSVQAVLEDGLRFGDFVSLWDQATGSLLIKTTHAAPADMITYTVTWGDEAVPTTEPYQRTNLSIRANGSTTVDAPFIVRDTTTSTRSLKRCDGDGELVYVFDQKDYPDGIVSIDVFYNFKVEVSADDRSYTTVAQWEGEAVNNMTNRTTVVVFLSDYAGADGKAYIRLSNPEPTQDYGTGLTGFTVNYRTPLSE